MYRSLTLLLAATTALVGNAVAAPVVPRQTVDAIPVMPGGVENLVITAANTLNATNPVAVPSQSNVTIHSLVATPQLPMSLVNNIGGAVNAYVTGLDPTGRIVFVLSSGQFYYPPADASYTTPVEVLENVAIPLNTA